MQLLIAIPAYNEAALLARNVERLLAFCQEQLQDWQWQIVIVDNGSTDATGAIADSLARRFPAVSVRRVALPGKGRAIRAGWLAATADVYCFMDADLATELEALPRLLASLGTAELAIGSRAHLESVVRRRFTRRYCSAGYRLLARVLVQTRLQDLPCGFKAITHRACQVLLPMVEDNGWFFDSELVLLAERRGYQIAQIPVRWSEPRSASGRHRLNIFSVSVQYARQLWRMRRRLITR